MTSLAIYVYRGLLDSTKLKVKGIFEVIGENVENIIAFMKQFLSKNQLVD